MTVLKNVFGSLQQMNSYQLLFGLLAFMCYAALQGSLFDGLSKVVSAVLGLFSAFGFVLSSTEWVYGFMLLAFAIAGLGIFAALVWLLGGLLGFNGQSAPRVMDSMFPESNADLRPTVANAQPVRPLAASHLTAHSH